MAEQGRLIACDTVESWNQHLQSAKDSKKLLVVYFTASWCGPCRLVTPVLDDLAKKLPQVTFLKVDIDELQSVALDWEIKTIPTIIFMKEGNIIDKLQSANPTELKNKVNLHASA